LSTHCAAAPGPLSGVWRDRVWFACTVAVCSQYVTVLFFAVSEFLKCVRSGLLGFVVLVS